MSIDFHVCPSADLSLIRGKLAKLGIIKAILQPIDVDPSFLFAFKNALNEVGIKTGDLLIWYRFSQRLIGLWSERMYDNIKLIRDVNEGEYKDFYIPMGSVDPAFGVKYVIDKLSEIDKLNIPGIVVSPILQLFNPITNKAFRQVLNYVERTNKLLILHFDPCPRNMPICIDAFTPNAISEILERYNITLVISVLGISDEVFLTWLKNIAKVMKKYDKVYLETSGINCNLVSTPMGRGFMKSVGIERFLFGTGYPYIRYWRVIHEINCVKSEISKDDQERFMFYNAKELLGEFNNTMIDLNIDVSYD